MYMYMYVYTRTCSVHVTTCLSPGSTHSFGTTAYLIVYVMMTLYMYRFMHYTLDLLQRGGAIKDNL